MNEHTELLTQRFKELPSQIKGYLKKDSWSNELETILKKHSLHEEEIEAVTFEVLLYLVVMQDRERTREEIKQSLSSLPNAIATMVVNEVLGSIPEDIHTTIADLFSQIPEKVPEDDENDTEDVPNNLPTEDIPPQKETAESAQTESVGGVDIIPEETEQEDDTTLGKNSLIQSIEDPEKTRPTETQSQFNPVRSKLGNNQEAQQPASSPQYGEGDPYREPIS